MKPIYFALSIIFAFSSFVAAQQQPAWNLVLRPNTVVSSTLSVVNQCKGPHQFEIQKQQLPFFNLGQDRVQVPGGQAVNIPVQFDTNGLPNGPHQGQLIVACLTCRNELGCSQDRENLGVIVDVQPGPQTAATPKPSPSPSGPQFNGPPRLNTGEEWQTLAKRTGAEFDKFIGGGCISLANDCEDLRRRAAELEADAIEAQRKADDLKKAADRAKGQAESAENNSKKAADAAKPTGEGGTITAEGESFSEADSKWLEEKRKKLLDDWLAGRITAAEQQAQRAALSGPEALRKAREERLAHEARLRKEAEEAKAAAEKAQAEAAKAKADSDAARKAADVAKSAADAAIEEYKKCVKAIDDECARVAAEEKKKRDAAAAAAARQAESDKKKRDEEARSAAQQAEVDYLLDNFKRLGLITHLPNTKIPDALDPAFDALQKITGETIRNFLQQVAGQVGGGPIDPNYINALGEAYKAMSALFNMRTKAGLERVHRLLTTKIINPRTGKFYTDDQAWNKIKRMEDLMERIKAKLAQHGK